MVSVAMNVIIAAQNNDTLVLKQPITSQLLKNPTPLQIEGAKDKNRVIRVLGVWEKTVHNEMERGM